MSDEQTPSAFLENAPLFSRVKFKGGFSQPGSISLDCSTCGKETTWAAADIQCGLSATSISLFTCSLCKTKTVTFFVFAPSEREGDQWVTFAQKVGQLPAPSIAIAPGLAKHLGKTADLYKKALICRNQGYGIAAVAYMRRIVEERTDELIGIVAEQAKERGVGDKDVDAILAAKKEQTYSEKLRVASELIPDRLRPGGVNPLGTLFGLLSDGLHDRSEEECLAIADEIREVFEYVFENLRTQIEDEKRFKDRVSKLASRMKP